LRLRADELQGEVDRQRVTEAELSGELQVQTRKGAKAEELLRLFVETVEEYAIFMLDPTGHVATWNPGAQRIKGFTAKDIIGSHFSRFYPQSDIDAGKCEMELEGAARVGRFEDEGWRLRKDGTRFWANVVISAVRDERGALIGFSKITRDLTERKRAEEDSVARLAAEQANRAKDEFLAMLGHELRNPLAPILTALELVKMRGHDPAEKEHQVIERQVNHMKHLVDDLLDVSRIASGKVELVRTRLDLRAVLSRAIEMASPLLEQRQHELSLEVPAHELYVEGDEARLNQVFSNLMTNAAKYTPPGGKLRIAARIEGDQVLIDVVDTGIGIEPGLLPRVFDLFVQGYQSSERAVGGLGLGLTLVRSLVKLHGGTVVAHSAGRGQGSTFTVHLPIAGSPVVRPAGSSNARSLAVGTGKRILVVDDNEDARMLLAEVLEAHGHQVETAGDGAEALRVALASAPEIAILDLGLPVMDGFELAARLRAELPVTPRLIALTGYGLKNDRDRTAAAGFDEHLVKPVNMPALLKSLAADA
jgi:PAS domain S-box-containing protein